MTVIHSRPCGKPHARRAGGAGRGSVRRRRPSPIQPCFQGSRTNGDVPAHPRTRSGAARAFQHAAWPAQKGQCNAAARRVTVGPKPGGRPPWASCPSCRLGNSKRGQFGRTFCNIRRNSVSGEAGRRRRALSITYEFPSVLRSSSGRRARVYLRGRPAIRHGRRLAQGSAIPSLPLLSTRGRSALGRHRLAGKKGPKGLWGDRN